MIHAMLKSCVVDHYSWNYEAGSKLALQTHQNSCKTVIMSLNFSNMLAKFKDTCNITQHITHEDDAH